MRRFAALLVAIAIVIGIAERGRGLLEDYEGGHRGACAALFSILAKNHLRYGILETGGVPVLNPVKVATEHFAYYMHHPPGTVLIAWVGAGLTGTRPAGLRFVFLVFAIAIVVVIGRLARGGETPTRATALCVAATLPVLVYYGPFPNFELPTLFFALLALHLFLRYLRRGRSKDAWRAAWAQALAVGCDWIALGLPLLIALLLPFRAHEPRTFADGRRVRRGFAVGLLFVGTVAAVVTVKLLYTWQLSRYGHPADGSGGNALLYVWNVTPLSKAFELGPFLERMRAYSAELIGWPALIVAAIGLVTTLPNLVRRRLGDGEFAAFVALGLGLGNLVVLAVHASRHDYYMLYVAPAIALFVAQSVRRLAGARSETPRAAAALALTAALTVVLAFRSHTVTESRRNFDLARLGHEIAAQTQTRESDPIFLFGNYTLQVLAQSDRYIDGVLDLQDFAVKRDRAWKHFGMGGRKTLFLASEDQVPGIEPSLRAWLDRTSPRTRLGPFVAWELGVLESIVLPSP
ncbi:MAG: glycosyltransferase family 39 protein [Planctomycetes bacterium]|nr:glycosyltransferase family 39 protein [Planctomycetota bacterium]MCC7170884.1 glycosyltransferase family 39 protein [Planctomycetota bacterium]